MKKLVLAIITVLTLSFNPIQAQVDLSDTLFYPTPATSLYEGIDFVAGFRILNPGPVFPSDSTVSVDITVNGTVVNTLGPVQFQADFPSGGQSQVLTLPVAGTSLAGSAGGTATICAVVNAQGDTNSTNDQSCQTVNIQATPTLDFGVTNVEVYVDGSLIPAGGDISRGSTIDSVKIEITNNTANELPVGFPISYQVQVGDSITPLAVTTGGFAANGTSIRLITNPAILDGLPTSGTVEICATTTIAGDADNSNDSNCGASSSTYTIVPPAGIEDAANAEVKVEVRENTLFISQNQEYSQVSLINMIGQEVWTNTLSENNRFDLSELGQGFYILSLTGDQENTYTEKVYIR